jgi:glutathione S-transferase
MPAANRLVTLVFSHYNEKARWALDYCGIPYRETRLMPGFSQLGVLVATRGRGGKADAVSSHLSTPVLFTDDGATLCDSTDIARWASSRVSGGGPGPLFPDPAVLELVEGFGRELGPHTRLVGYWHAFRSPTALRTLADANVGRLQAIAAKALAPLGKALLQRGLGLSDERQQRSMDRVRAELALVEARLERGRYLVGDTFSAADLTFAALMAPVLLVSRAEGYGATLPGLDEFGPDARAVVAEMRATRAGRFALDMFARHRHGRAPAATSTRGVPPAAGRPRSTTQPSQP